MRRSSSEKPELEERALLRARRDREIGTLGLGASANVVLAYPSPYAVGMSSVGFQTLYKRLNEGGITTHRAFLPDAWSATSLDWPQPRRPILTYEAEAPLSHHRIIALSVAYELEIAGVIRMLEGAGIPVLAADRGPRDPIVIAGGPITTTNASVLLPFVDLLLAGDGEEILPATLEILLTEPHRRTALELAAQDPHVCLGEIEPGLFSELPPMAKAPTSLLPATSAILTPDAELSDMFLIEPERGCSRRCTFCVMRGASTGGMRLVEQDTVLSLIPAEAKRVGLVGAAVTDIPDVEDLVARIVDSGRGVGVSSLRADRLTPSFLQHLARGGYRSITVASDGISERMRRFLDRKIHADDLRRAASLVAQHGFRHLKVYEMIGVPGETDDDVDELIAFALELRETIPLVLTFSTLVAKRNTPLDGQPFMGVKAAEARLARIRKGLGGRVEMRPQPPKWAWVEYVLSAHGPEVGHAALAAVRAGGSYAAWKAAFATLPESPARPLRFGDERRLASRTGFAAARPRLPVLV